MGGVENEMTLIKITFLVVQEQSNLTPEIRAPQDTFIGVRTVYCESIIIFLCTYGIACVVMQVYMHKPSLVIQTVKLLEDRTPHVVLVAYLND